MGVIGLWVPLDYGCHWTMGAIVLWMTLAYG